MNKNVMIWLSKPMIKSEVISWFRSNDIIIEQMYLYRDFIFKLIYRVGRTYLGLQEADRINASIKLTDENKKDHFDWCWKQVVESFEEEDIFFGKSGEHKDFLWNIMWEMFYNEDNVRGLEEMLIYMSGIFNVDHTYNRSDLDILTELYKKMEKNFLNLYLAD